MIVNFKTIAAAAAVATSLVAVSPAQAQYSYVDEEFDFTTLLTGNITNNSWWNLTAFQQTFGEVTIPGNTGFPGFPGSGAWPHPIASQVDASVGSVGDTLGGAGLYKVANGPGGGPYPASGSIYYGGFSGDANLNGGTLAVQDTTPLAGLGTIVFQVGIGEAWTYDFLNHELPTLTLTHSSGTTSGIGASFSQVLSKFFNGTVTMPSGEEDVYINQYALQWDVSGYSDISSFEVVFTGVQHAQLYGLTLTQSDVFTQAVPVPEPTTYAMMMAGLGVIGAVVRRRRKQQDA